MSRVVLDTNIIVSAALANDSVLDPSRLDSRPVSEHGVTFVRGNGDHRMASTAKDRLDSRVRGNDASLAPSVAVTPEKALRLDSRPVSEHGVTFVRGNGDHRMASTAKDRLDSRVHGNDASLAPSVAATPAKALRLDSRPVSEHGVTFVRGNDAS